MKNENKVFLKTLSILCIPIVLNELLNSSINMMDTFMIGQLGDEPVAAVGLANQIFFLFTLFLFGINSGATIFMGQYWGKGEIDNVHKVMGISVTASLLVSVVFCFGAVLIPDTLMSIYSQDNRVIALGVDYLRVISVSYLLTALVYSLNTALRAIGKTQFPMITTFISLVSNIVFNYIFIFVFDMGVIGAALGTLIARSIEFLSQILIIVKTKQPIIAKFRNYFKSDIAFLQSYFSISFPVILNEVMWSLGTSIYNVAYKYSGTQAQAAVQISSTVQNLFLVFGMAIGTATSIMLTNTLGAGDREKAVSYSKKSLWLSGAMSVFMGVILCLSADLIVNIFDVGETVKQYAKYILYVIAVVMAFKTINYTCVIGILRSGGDTKFCFIVDTLSVWLVGVPMAFLGSYFLQLPIYVTVGLVFLEEIFKLAIFLKRVLSYKWAKTII